MKERLLKALVFSYDTVALLLAAYISVRSSNIMRSVFPEAYMYFSSLIISLVLFYLVALYYSRLYDLHSAAHTYRFIPAVFNSTLLTFVSFNFFAFFVLKYPASRRFLVVFFLISPILLLLRNKFVSLVSTIFKFDPCIGKKVLIIGDATHAEKLVRLLHCEPFPGMKVIGRITEEPDYEDQRAGWLNDRIENFLAENQIDEIFFCAPDDWISEVNKAMILCCNLRIRFHVYTTMFNLILGEANQEDFFGHPLFSFQNREEAPVRLAIKRLCDIVISATMLILLSPIFIFTAILIKLFMPGQVLFSQTRSGKNCCTFKLLKFRSMIADAEAFREDLEAQNEAEGPVFKIKDDPRITALGKFIRKFSIDELPQLWNVLKGDMSLVGPRPPIPAEVDKYEPWQLRRLDMRPGLSCIWQVSGRNKISFNDWMKMDLYYVDNWSLWLDFKILLRTVPAVLTGEGAH
ncbi:MAG: sugar transferase [Candidatus Riflebacteria bacterium]|nr:sugar transferase [Candidatus Riflebacteria bacterium]